MEQLTGNININALDGCKNVTLNIKNISISSFNYDFLSTKSRNAHVYAGEELIFYPSSAIKSSTVNNALKTIKIQTTYADMYVYTK